MVGFKKDINQKGWNLSNINPVWGTLHTCYYIDSCFRFLINREQNKKEKEK